MSDKKEQILDYLLDELTAADKAAFEEALALSDELREACEAERQIISAVAVEPDTTFEKDLSVKIQNIVAAKAPVRASAGMFWRAAAALLLVGFTLYLLNLQTSVVQPAAVEHQASSDAVNWLIEAQEASGSWDAKRWGGNQNFTVGLTGLSLLALQGDQNENVVKARDKALGFLLENQSKEGLFGIGSQTGLYNHALASLALLEMAQSKKDKTLSASLEKGIQFIVDSQEESGGWGYVKSPGSENSSITLWQVNVLSVAKGLGYKNVEEALSKGQLFLKASINESGQMLYSSNKDFPHGREALTAMSSYYFRMFDENKNGKNPTVAGFIKSPDEKMDFYRDFFLLSAADLEKIEAGPLVTKITKAQVGGGFQKGSWRPDGVWGSAGGRIYSTAMAALSLQVSDRSQRTMALLQR